ncbi:MAG: DEAD/DEAH box helicase, partial [Ferruginibacter sp.]
MQTNNISITSLLSPFKIDSLNEMQEASIKANTDNDNVILLSATGSGKTLAYLIPLVQLLKTDSKKVQALVLVPSR